MLLIEVQIWRVGFVRSYSIFPSSCSESHFQVKKAAKGARHRNYRLVLLRQEMWVRRVLRACVRVRGRMIVQRTREIMVSQSIT